MSVPEHLPASTQETVYAIWSAHRLGPVTQITKPLTDTVLEWCVLDAH